MDPKTLFTIGFVVFVVLSFIMAGLVCRQQERRERLQERIRDSRPKLFC